MKRHLFISMTAVGGMLLSGCGGGSAPQTSAAPVQISQAPVTTPAEETSATSEAVKKVAVTAPTARTTELLLKSNQVVSTIPLIKPTAGIGIHIKGTVTNASVSNIQIDAAKSAVYVEPTAIIRNLLLKDITITQTQREGIRLRGDVDGVAIQNFSITMRNVPLTSPDLPEGIMLFEGRNISISDGYISGFKMVVIPGTYTNGDGMSAERLVDSLIISRVTASDNSDGGFDLKSTNTFLYDTRAERNYRNYRLWGTVQAGTIYSTDPRGAHVWAGNGAVVVIDKLVVNSTTTAAVVNLENVGSITIKSCELHVPAGTVFLKTDGKGVTSFGPGCAL